MCNNPSDVPSDVPPAMPYPAVVVVVPALPQPPQPAANGRDDEKISLVLTPGMKRGFFAVVLMLLAILALKAGVDPTGLIPTRI